MNNQPIYQLKTLGWHYRNAERKAHFPPYYLIVQV